MTETELLTETERNEKGRKEAGKGEEYLDCLSKEETDCFRHREREREKDRERERERERERNRHNVKTGEEEENCSERGEVRERER